MNLHDVAADPCINSNDNEDDDNGNDKAISELALALVSLPPAFTMSGVPSNRAHPYQRAPHDGDAASLIAWPDSDLGGADAHASNLGGDGGADAHAPNLGGGGADAHGSNLGGNAGADAHGSSLGGDAHGSSLGGDASEVFTSCQNMIGSWHWRPDGVVMVDGHTSNESCQDCGAFFTVMWGVYGRAPQAFHTGGLKRC